MSYTISSRLLPTDYREEMITKTLDLYLEGENLRESPLVVWGRKVVNRGDWWYGCEGLAGQEREACILSRQRAVIKLYHSLKEKGYEGSPISVYFDKETGDVQTYDGFHRLSIMKYLGLEADMNCVVSHHHPDPNQRGDFPLTETLVDINSGKNLYQPLEDPRVEGWNTWRPDSQNRLIFLLDNLVPGTVCDVGCSTGFFSRGLTRAGFKTTGLEANKKRIAIARYMAAIKNIEMDFIEGRWQHELNGRKFDNIIFLSVLHHDVLAQGLDQLKKDLEILRSSTARIVVEMPLASAGVKWLDKERKDIWDFTSIGLVNFLEEATDMRLLKQGIGVLQDRPLLVLEGTR